jgi:large subunit ribosomal protein L25
VPEVHISAEPRTEFGKGPARRERRAGRVPAVLYGHGTEPRHLSLPGHDVLLALRTANVLIRLDGLADGAAMALPRAVQRDPLRGSVEHVDLLLVRRGEKVTVDIPVTLTGEVVSEGMLNQQMVQVSVEADATRIPPGVELSVEGLEVGASVHVRDLELPRGVSLIGDPEQLVLQVVPAPTAEQMEADLGLPEAEPAAEGDEEGVAAAADGEQPAAEATQPGDAQPGE